MNQGTQTAEQMEGTPAQQVTPNGPQVERRVNRPRQGFMGVIQSAATTVVIALFVITFAIQAFQIPSESMENTLLIGDYLLVDKVHFGHGGVWGDVEPYRDIATGDIVVFRYPVNPTQHFVKRVIGVPGDRIRLDNKRVYVNGTALKEQYVVYRDVTRDSYRDDFPKIQFPTVVTPESLHWWRQMRELTHNGELTVPAGQYFVLGDNRDQSLDSRYWGFVPRENIIGRPLVIYWSMRHPERMEAIAVEPESVSDKLVHFTYTIGHLLQETRWDRTFRLIK
ncbi:MAG TPA: signal peptidase I [Terriglobales bacterium]|nr:signal peptidase I [Terriglobales bacterium]